ncbi:MAG: class I SAM-dependent methyltransferase [Candidatus Omnitrophica bacterium]|nr:class I SAM-dependent methyltransferase [Candidatus Omnitrophota bacterium]
MSKLFTKKNRLFDWPICRRKLLGVISTLMILQFTIGVPISDALSPPPGITNPLVLRKAAAYLQRLGVRVAESDYEKDLLRRNNTSCMVLYSGTHLVDQGMTEDIIGFLREVVSKETQTLMQILSFTDEGRYRKIKQLIIELFPPEGSDLPENEYVDQIVARAFGWLALVDNGILFRDEVSPEDPGFIDKIEEAVRANKDNLFTEEFWNPKLRKERIWDPKIVDDKMRAMHREEDQFFVLAPDEEKANDNSDMLRTLAARFREKRHQEGIRLREAYDEILVSILTNLKADPGSADDDPDEVLIKAFRDNGVKRILELGCGDCTFMMSLITVAQRAGCTLTGIDRDPSHTEAEAAEMSRSGVTTIYRGDANKFKDEEGFDLVISSGVMSMFGSLPMGERLNWRALKDALSNALNLAGKSVSLLNNRPRSAVYINSFGTVLMLYEKDLEEVSEVIRWDRSRLPDSEKIYYMIDDIRGKKLWEYLHKKAATLAVLAKKKSQPHVHDEVAKIPYDAIEARVLGLDLISSKKSEEVSYDLRYDESRLSPTQIEVIEEYVRILNKKFGLSAKAIGFHKKDGSKKSLISVELKNKRKEVIGTGEVDISEEYDLKEYILRITGMLNMAVASSNIREGVLYDNATDHERRLMSYIRYQCASVIGEENNHKIPESFDQLLKFLKVLPLPEMCRVSIEKIIENYNTEAKKALISV